MSTTGFQHYPCLATTRRLSLHTRGCPQIYGHSLIESCGSFYSPDADKKIIQTAVRLLPGKRAKSGDYVTITPHHCLTHDNSWPVAVKFMSIMASEIHDNLQIVMALNHDVQNKSESNLKSIGKLKSLLASMASTLTLRVMYLWWFELPRTPVVQTDAASIWATGQAWWEVPAIAKVTLTVIMPPGVTGKDVIVALCGIFNQDDVLNHAIEFTGSEDTMRSVPIDDRLTISNIWLRGRATTSAMFDLDSNGSIMSVNPGAIYAKSLYIDLSTLSPFVAGPNSVKVTMPSEDLEAQNIPLNKAYLASCTNSRASDVAAAARVFRDATKDGVTPKIAPGVSFYMAAASISEQEASESAGDWQILLAAGAQPLPSDCGPCIGLGTSRISSSNRNFKGRMGSTEAKAYLKPESVEKVIIGEGSGNLEADKALSIEDALDKLLAEAENMIAVVEQDLTGSKPVEVPRPVERLREAFKTDGKKVLTRQKDGKTWSQMVGELPPNVQEIIAKSGLEN
ncbi:Homoaconitate hydratase [Cladobotryum mycophilum]|uniref:Homoaconitate hydratase n=1 Tax=Cladobotryum mycophilum TaxID=491253 RepID=A0ABR0SP04_9HYPO